MITILVLLLGVVFCVLTIVILNDIYIGIQTVLISFVVLTVLEVSFVGIALAMSNIPVPERFNSRYLMVIVICGVLGAIFLFFVPTLGAPLLLFALLGLFIVMLPPSWKVSVKLALRNIGRQRTRSATTMLALFIGVFAVGLILVLGQDLRDQLEKAISKDAHYNVIAVATIEEAKTVQAKQAAIPGLKAIKPLVYAQTVPLMINGKTLLGLFQADPYLSKSQLNQERQAVVGLLSRVEGYNVTKRQFPEVQITSGRNLGPGDEGTDHVLIPSVLAEYYSLRMKVGDTITLSSVDGKTTRAVTVVGVYREVNTDFNTYKNVAQIKTTADTARALSQTGREWTLYYMQIDPQKVSRAEIVIGNLAPNGFIVNVADIGSVIDQYLSDFLLILTTVASFSLLAGIIIIANAVALAMLERRREIGILKSVGYTSGTVLRQVLIENGVVGGTSALLATLLIAVTLSFLGHYIFGGVSLEVSLLPVLLLISGATLLAMITALLVAWGAVRVRPVAMLRYE